MNKERFKFRYIWFVILCLMSHYRAYSQDVTVLVKPVDKSLNFATVEVVAGPRPAKVADSKWEDNSTKLKSDIEDALTSTFENGSELRIVYLLNYNMPIEEPGLIIRLVTIHSEVQFLDSSSRELARISISYHYPTTREPKDFVLRQGLQKIAKKIADYTTNTFKKKNKGDTGKPPISSLTSLLDAIWQGNEKAVQVLLDQGADVNASRLNKETALMVAALKGQPAIVQALLNKGADVNAKRNDGWTSLMAAASFGHTAIVQGLLEKDADINAKTTVGYTPLMAAVGSGDVVIVQALLDKGADVNAEKDSGDTALMLAAFQGHTAIVRALLSKGADVDVVNNNGATALSVARKSEIVELLKNAKTKK